MSGRRTALLLGAAGAAAAVAVGSMIARPDAPSAGAVDGATLFVEKGCAACHGGRDGSGGIIAGVAPPLDDAAEWAGNRVEGLSAREYLTRSIVAPWEFVSPAWGGPSGPTTHMPALALTDDEVAAIVDLLLTPPPDRQG